MRVADAFLSGGFDINEEVVSDQVLNSFLNALDASAKANATDELRLLDGVGSTR